MLISVQLHTTLQRQSPQGLVRQLEVQLAPGSTLGDLLIDLGITLRPVDLLLVVNGRTAAADQVLFDGDQVHLIPAISGGMRGTDMKPIKWIVFLVIVLSLLIGCSSSQSVEPADQAKPAQTTPTVSIALPVVSGGENNPEQTATDANQPESPILLTVKLPDGTSKGFSLVDLESLPQASINVEGKEETGPILNEVLKAAGVTDFIKVTLEGSGSLTLTKDQVTQETLLDFTNRGTVKFASPTVPKVEWPKDIVTITVE